MKPRDFHIGTKVVNTWATDEVGREPATVYNCLPDMDNIGARIVVLNPYPWSNDWLYSSDLVHASDGAPLGEWVPIKVDSEHTSGFGSISEDGTSNGEYFDISVHTVNAIIRGEVQQ